MINIKSEETKYGYDTICEIRGRGDCVYNELRILISELLSNPELTEMFTRAIDRELKKVEEHD